MDTFLQLEISDERESDTFRNTLSLKIVQADLTTEERAASLGTHNLMMATNYTDSDGNFQIRASPITFTVKVICDSSSYYYPYTNTGLPCPEVDFCAENYKINGHDGTTCTNFNICLAGIGEGTGYDH